MVNIEEFNQAADKVKGLSEKPTDSELLQLYSFFKQGTVGDCNTTRPGLLDFKGKAKWDSWNALKGKSKEQAMEDYVELVRALQERYK